MSKPRKDWEIYELAAQQVVSDLKDNLQVDRVEGKQKLTGASGATWEIDAKALKANGINFLIVEARQHRKKRLDQEAAGGGRLSGWRD